MIDTHYMDATAPSSSDTQNPGHGYKSGQPLPHATTQNKPNKKSIKHNFLDGSPLQQYLGHKTDTARNLNTSTHSTHMTSAAQEKAAEKQALMIGMNLGTARSCIAGAGTRVAVDTCARGAMSSQANATPSVDELRSLLTYLVGLVNADSEYQLSAVIGVPAQASRRTKQDIIEASRGILHHVMLVPEPFAVAYGLDRITHGIVVDIGAATTDLCRLHGSFPDPEDHLSLPVAGNTIDRKLYDLIKAEYPSAEITLNLCKQFKERHGFVSSPTGPVQVRFTADGHSGKHDIADILHRSCNTVIEPAVTAIHQLLATANPAYHKTLLNNVILSGGGAMLDGLDQQLGQELTALGGAKLTIVDDPLYAAATGALKLAKDLPNSYWQQLS